MDPISVVARRGGVVESRHLVDAVVVQGGAVVEEAGDGMTTAFLRSAAKPFQALPLVRSRDDLTTEEIAIAAASHLAQPAQLDAVRSLLAKAPATEDELECGTVGPESGPTKLEHNCSGKHAGMLALCRSEGWESAGYRLADHPVQRACAAEIAASAEVSRDEMSSAVDGCGVITFALPLERMGLLFARLEERPGGPEVAAAMRAHPELIRGLGAPDTMLMQRLEGWTAKGGAEGLLCACGPGGLGLALKVADGNGRAVGPALAELLHRLGHEIPGLGVVVLENSRGERVGELVSERL